MNLCTWNIRQRGRWQVWEYMEGLDPSRTLLRHEKVQRSYTRVAVINEMMLAQQV